MQEPIKIQYYKSPVGEIILGSFDNKLCLADWRYRKMRDTIDNRIKSNLKADYTPIIDKTITQLEEYFKQERKEFDIDLLFVGTDFQKSVWKELTKISFGKTLSYLQLSKNLNNPKAIRAVASANGANAISILVPCHRIIGFDGKLVGYAGGLSAKKKLLQLEGAFGEQLRLFS